MANYNAADSASAEQLNIVFTQAAAEKVYELIRDEENFDLKLRAYIQGGGCSGFQYGFTFDEKPQHDDTIVARTVQTEQETDFDVELLIDPMSFQYLSGAEIDYREDLQGERFVIYNPNAKGTCGCGSSFNV